MQPLKESGRHFLEALGELAANRAQALLGAATAIVAAAFIGAALLITMTAALAVLVATLALDAGWTPAQAAAAVSVLLLAALAATALIARGRARSALKPAPEKFARQLVASGRSLVRDVSGGLPSPMRWARAHPAVVVGASAALGLALSAAVVPSATQTSRKESA